MAESHTVKRETLGRISDKGLCFYIYIDYKLMFQITKNTPNLLNGVKLFFFFSLSLSWKSPTQQPSNSRTPPCYYFHLLYFLGLIYNFSREFTTLFLKSVGYVTTIYIHNMGLCKLSLIANFSKGFRTMFLKCINR